MVRCKSGGFCGAPLLYAYHRRRKRKGCSGVIEQLDFLREMSFVSVLFRLVLAMLFGGFLGLERQSKGRPAGFRTYMLVCIGATLTMILGQYEHTMLSTAWAEIAEGLGARIDVSRFGAQVINGIGFLGAGTIIYSGRKGVKGITTAAGLWAAGCMGLAIGACFYECVFLAVILILLVTRLLPMIEDIAIQNSRNMNIYVEFRTLDNMGPIINCIKQQDIQIFEVDIRRGREEKASNPSAVFSVRFNSKQPHTRVLSALSDLDDIYTIEEV